MSRNKLKEVASSVEAELNRLVSLVRRLDNDGNYVDCEVVVKATILVINGDTANDAFSAARQR